MRPIEISSVTDCQVVFSDGTIIILSGKNPWLFRKDGSFIAKYKNIRNAYEMIFLPDNTVMMNGAVDRAYHLISLENGEVLWSCPQKGRREMGPHQFAASPDGQIIYFVYRNKQHILQIDRLVPCERSCKTYEITMGIRATTHCYCDGEGNLCMLQTFIDNDCSEKADRKITFYTGVLCWSPNRPEPTWKYLYETDPDKNYYPCACNDEYLLFDSLLVKSFTTGEIFDLIENSRPIIRAGGDISALSFDSKRKLLTVRFTSSWSTIIIDCNARKIIAHYAPISKWLGSGCLIDDEFWVGTNEGIVRRPFPHMDPFPKCL